MCHHVAFEVEMLVPRESFRVHGLGFRIRVENLEFRVKGLGFEVETLLAQGGKEERRKGRKEEKKEGESGFMGVAGRMSRRCRRLTLRGAR